MTMEISFTGTKHRRVDDAALAQLPPALERDECRQLAFDIIDKLEAERVRRGISQQAVADLIGTYQGTISQGTKHVNVTRADLLCGFAYAVGMKLVLVPWDEE